MEYSETILETNTIDIGHGFKVNTALIDVIYPSGVNKLFYHVDFLNGKRHVMADSKVLKSKVIKKKGKENV